MILDYAVKAKNMFTELVDFLVGWVRSAEPLTLIFVAVVVILVSVVMFKR